MYTPEEIKLIIENYARQWTHWASNLEHLYSDADFVAIQDYLTGKSSTLGPLSPSAWSGLLGHVLTGLWVRPDQAPPHQQRLYDVITNPHIYQAAKYHLKATLADTLLKNDEEALLKATLAEFSKLNMTEIEIFELIVVHAGYTNEIDITIQPTPVKNYLLSQAKKFNKVLAFSGLDTSGSHRWEHFYFQLLESATPALVAPFINEWLGCGAGQLIKWLYRYKGGEYMPLVESFFRSAIMQEMRPPRPMALCVSLYSLDSTYSDLIVPHARHYLDTFFRQFESDSYEGGDSRKLPDGSHRYYTYPVWGFYFLIKYNDKAEALKLLDSWYEKPVYVNPTVLEMLHMELGPEAAAHYFQKAMVANWDINYYREVVKFGKTALEPSQYLPSLWGQIGNKSKQLRTLISGILASDDADATKKALTLLSDKSTDTRLTAALILAQAPVNLSEETILSILHKESNDNTRDLLLQSFAGSLPREASDDSF